MIYFHFFRSSQERTMDDSEIQRGLEEPVFIENSGGQATEVLYTISSKALQTLKRRRYRKTNIQARKSPFELAPMESIHFDHCPMADDEYDEIGENVTQLSLSFVNFEEAVTSTQYSKIR